MWLVNLSLVSLVGELWGALFVYPWFWSANHQEYEKNSSQTIITLHVFIMYKVLKRKNKDQKNHGENIIKHATRWLTLLFA